MSGYLYFLKNLEDVKYHLQIYTISFKAFFQ